MVTRESAKLDTRFLPELIRKNARIERAKLRRRFPAYKYKINQYTGEGYSDNRRIR
jgi:hypothetical protein